MSENLFFARLDIERKLDEIREAHFKPEVKLTFVMRHPDMPDCHLVITDDSVDEIVAALEHDKKADVPRGQRPGSEGFKGY